MLGKIKKRPRRGFPVKPGAMDKGEPAGWQFAVCKGDKNQGFFGNIPFNAKKRLERDTAAIPRQRRHQAQENCIQTGAHAARFAPPMPGPE